MGGSALSGRIIKHLFYNRINLPFEIVSGYSLPAWVNKNSLVIASSYSGNTEETLNCLNQANKKEAQIAAVTTGGKIASLINSHQINGLVYTPQHNPLGFPKTAIGYSLGSLLALLSRLSVIDITEQVLDKSLAEFKKIQFEFLLNNPLKSNQAKLLAQKIYPKVPVFIASEHLIGAAYCARNQVHEIAHRNSLFYDLPEVNHHLVEALSQPVCSLKELSYIFVLSDSYQPRVLKRYKVMEEVLTKLKINYEEYRVKTKDSLAQTLEVINLGGFLAGYLSFLADEDPGPEPWIIYFKKKLGAPLH